MNRHTLLAILTAIAAGMAFTHAASAAEADAKPAKTATAKSTKAKTKAKAKPAAAKMLPAATPEQTAAAERALKGEYTCDSGKKITVADNAKSPGYVDMTSGKTTYTMKPEVTATGTVRMEDVGGHVELLQIANKSMVMDVKKHTRLMDCVHPSQQ